MPYTPRFRYTTRLVGDLMRIEGARRILDTLSLPPDVGLLLRHEARKRSTHHSTRIEGNRLTEAEVPAAVVNPANRRSPDAAEVRNYWRALEWVEIEADRRTAITEDSIRTLHAIILIRSPGGRPKKSAYRQREIGVIDSARGDYEYMAPSPEDVPPLMAGLVGWIESGAARELPAPVRAAILAYQFVTIHPFVDGNGRAARALATLELWRSGYDMRGFLSMEEHYTRDLAAYYASLQMGLPANYYRGRNDPDLTPWLEYFCVIMADAAADVAERAERFSRSARKQVRAPWEALSRPKQQLLSRCLALAAGEQVPPTFKPQQVAEWFRLSSKSAREWLQEWSSAGFVEPASGQHRVRRWRLSPSWERTVLRLAGARPGNKAANKGSRRE